MSMPTRRAHVVLLLGELVAYDKTADSARILRWMACSPCRTRVWVEPLSAPSILVVKPGTLDDMSWAVPVGNIWTASKAPWVQIDEALLNFPGQPPDRQPLYDAWHKAIIVAREASPSQSSKVY
jgi:hypothetical protein